MHKHIVRLYESDRYPAADIAAWLRAAVGDGGSGLMIATREHAEAITAHLPIQVRSRVHVRDAEEMLSTFFRDGRIQRARFLEAVGQQVRLASRSGQPVHAYGEMVAVLYGRGDRAAAVELEALWNDLLQEVGVRLLCAYPIAQFAGAEHAATFESIVAGHDGVVSLGGNAVPEDDALRLRIAQLEQKAGALEAEVRRREGAESELQAFLDHAFEGLHRFDAQGRLAWANKALLDLVGHAGPAVIGRPVSELYADADLPGRILESLRRGEVVRGRPARLRCMDGSMRDVLLHARLQPAGGSEPQVLCFTRDISDRLRLEEERQRRLDQLAEADRRKDEFLAMLAHELRNPLAPIAASVELVRAYRDDPVQMERWLGTIERQMGVMNRLVDDLLDVSRITRGRVVLHRENLAVGLLVERAVEMVRPYITARQHHLQVDVQEGLWVAGDPTRLAQVLANLLHNAAKFTEPGGRIRLGAAADGEHVLFSVSDTGMGIAPDLADKIFGLFVQGETLPGQVRAGLGLGLSVVRSLVELHGGRVEAHSPGVGQGSTFSVRLPVGIPVATVQADVAPVLVEMRPRRVLIVDDNADVATSLREVFRLAGHVVDDAPDGFVAIAKAAELCPEVLILDIGMPGMDGYELARRLRSEPATAGSLFIALSGFAQDRDRAKAMAAGFDHHFAKPADVRRLMATIAAWRSPAEAAEAAAAAPAAPAAIASRAS